MLVWLRLQEQTGFLLVKTYKEKQHETKTRATHSKTNKTNINTPT
jgi:hypothetical protein